MDTYLIVYYGSTVPTFSYAETLEGARAYALLLLTSDQCKRNDVLSIVDVADDCVVYYGKRDKLIATFNAIDHPTVDSGFSLPLSLRSALNWVNVKLAGPTAG